MQINNDKTNIDKSKDDLFNHMTPILEIQEKNLEHQEATSVFKFQEENNLLYMVADIINESENITSEDRINKSQRIE